MRPNPGKKVVPLSLVNSLVGMPEDKAIAKIQAEGYRSRVLARDGQGFVGTADYRTDRVNLGIEDKIVVSAKIG